MLTSEAHTAHFSASRFALPSIPLMILHSWVTSVFWSKVSTKSPFLSFVCVDAVRDVIIQSLQFRQGGISFTDVISSCHHIQYLCWYMFLVESVSSSNDVVSGFSIIIVRKILSYLWQFVGTERLLSYLSFD